MADVKWIKLKVGMFDGMSFKKIKKAKIGGESFRDKLTAVWFELMDFAGKCNHDGAFISPREIPFTDISDIAVMIDREEEELKLCMAFFINEGMVSVVDDIYMLSSWSDYQNTDGLEKIREQNRLRKQKQREKQKLLEDASRDSHGTVTECHGIDIEEDKEIDKEIDKDNENDNEVSYHDTSNDSVNESFTTPSNRIDYQQIVDLFNSICTSLPSVRSLSDARKKAIRARMTTYTVDDFRKCFENAESSSFLKGGNNRNWTATFDWLIKDTNMAKVLDGNYADKDKPKQTNNNGYWGTNQTDLDDLF